MYLAINTELYESGYLQVCSLDWGFLCSKACGFSVQTPSTVFWMPALPRLSCWGGFCRNDGPRCWLKHLPNQVIVYIHYTGHKK